MAVIGTPVVEGVGRIPGFVNAYVFREGSDTYLIDTTMNKNANPVRKAFAQAGVSLSSVGTILLTHAHVDHIRGALALEQASHAGVACHAVDAPAVDGRAPLRIPPVMRWFLRVRPVAVGRTLHDGDTIGPFRVVYAPGHTMGEVAFYHPGRRILFSGDSVVERKGKLTLPAAGFAADLPKAVSSLDILRKLQVDTLLPGHGVPVTRDVAPMLDELIRRAPRDYLGA